MQQDEIARNYGGQNGTIEHLLQALGKVMTAHSQALEILSLQSEENKKLKEQIELLEKVASQDGLTGLFNQAYFKQQLKAIGNAYDRSENEAPERRHTQGNAIIMIDMDYFKPINDTHGHAAGDEALKTVAGYLNPTCAKRMLWRA
ncbi:MAG: hypothetical protein DI626_04705 [Micavibrio aeruginosavorus]|uniref:diguanylate cyclase n=1 Tax=Micavibrio aeruginosavorus TaxID=349221 RepID=A0A2W5A3X6_9BACT|nr:MAG: hypothetical protein DI626_04705 [Micavibrio aeruginosavorus]